MEGFRQILVVTGMEQSGESERGFGFSAAPKPIPSCRPHRSPVPVAPKGSSKRQSHEH